jgi:geranyl-CoA carboxylase alpha subunit
LVEVFVKTGDHVKAGDRLALLEAMKMQHEILTDIDGTVAMIHAEAGAQIAADAPLFEISPDALADD